MTSGEPSGPSKARLAGFGLIGIGVIAAMIGGVTLVSGDEKAATQPLPSEQASSPVPLPTPVAPQPPVTNVAPPPTTQSPVAPVPPPAPPVAVPPDTQAPVQNLPVGTDEQATQIVVRVYNNSTIAGLAHRAAEDIKAAGYAVPEVGNYSAGRIPTTTFYFRPGTEEEQQATDLAVHFGARAEPRFDGIQDATPGLIAIITNDYRGPAAGK